MRVKGGGLVLALGLGVGLAALPAEAQRGPGLRGPAAGPFMGQSLEMLLENQEELGLGEDQLAQIRELKAVMDEDVIPVAEEMKALREQILAGDVDRMEGFRRMEAVRGRLISASAPIRGRIQEILTMAQHRELQALLRLNRPGFGRGGAAAMGRGGAWQGRAPACLAPGRGGRGAAGFRGSRGGFGPAQGRQPAMGPGRTRPGALWFRGQGGPVPPGPGGDLPGRVAPPGQGG